MSTLSDQRKEVEIWMIKNSAYMRVVCVSASEGMLVTSNTHTQKHSHLSHCVFLEGHHVAHLHWQLYLLTDRDHLCCGQRECVCVCDQGVRMCVSHTMHQTLTCNKHS